MKQQKITLLTSIGAGLEYYDLVIYSLLAKFISQQFFPGTSQAASLFAAFSVFALGSVVRPLGGVIFGIFGDRFGRKNVFANTLLWMSIATFLMGVTPTFATIGIAATVIFSLCRIVQGMVFGGELPGALTMLAEHIDVKQHGFYFGFMTSALTLGVLLGSFISWLLTKILSDAQILAWGFRLPFLFGGILAVVGFYIRRHVPETPAFLAQQQRGQGNKISFAVVKKHIWKILNIVGVLLLSNCFIVFFLTLPVYFQEAYNYKFSDIYLALTCGYIWSVVILPILGKVSDTIGRKVFLIWSSILMIVFGFPIFSLLQSGSLVALFGFVIFGQTLIAAMSVNYFVLLPRIFPTAIRYTGTAVGYNIALMLSTVTPLVANYVYMVLKKPHYMAWFFLVLSVITIISTLCLRRLQDN